MQNRENYITSYIKKPCHICGKLTDQIEICFEVYLCSKECEEVMNKKYIEYLNKVGDLEDFFNAE